MESTQPSSDHGRTETLASYDIMDTYPEMTFDQFTYIASSICQTPVSLLSFLDEDRQWFKSTYGLDISELPRHLSACNQTIMQNESYVIEDSLSVPSPFSEFMKQEGFRFYAGVPIISPEGNRMGALCVIDYKPRSITKAQLQTLKVLSNQIVDILKVRKRYQSTLEYLKELNDESLKTDKHIQDVAHRSAMKAMAELSSGLSYRIKPLLMSMMNDLGENIDAHKKLLRSNGRLIMQMLESLERFVEAEKEKTMKPVNLNFTLKNVLSHLEWKFKKIGIKISTSFEQDVMCVGNSSQLAQIFFIVLENACDAVEKYPHKNIHVGLSSGNHVAAIRISDSGEGVSESIRPFIFLPFFTTKSSEHLGIGLSMAQALTQRHFGEIVLLKCSGPTIFEIKLQIP